MKVIPFNTKHYFNNTNLIRLSNLKPASTKLILDSKVDLIELLKLTLQDLLLKKVLIINRETRRAHRNDLYAREYANIETGKNFKHYKADSFEKYFTDIIDEESYYPIKSYIKKIYKNIPSDYKYAKSIITDSKTNDLFKSHSILSVFRINSLNTSGNELQLEFINFINIIDEHISDLIENDSEKALELIIFLKGNIFLLNNISFEVFDKLKIDKAVVLKENYSSDDWIWFDTFLLDDFNDINDSIFDFSEMFDSFDDCFDFNDSSNWDSYDSGSDSDFFD